VVRHALYGHMWGKSFSLSAGFTHTHMHTCTQTRAQHHRIYTHVYVTLFIYTCIHNRGIVNWVFSFFHFYIFRGVEIIIIYIRKGALLKNILGPSGPQGEKRPLLGLLAPWWDDLLPGTFIIYNIHIYYT
jgi:hypothetical protein